MANKQALRDLQARLAERLSAVKTEPAAKSWLAVECGAHGFLFPLREAGEIFPLAALQPVPYSQGWFLGVANLRGHLHGVVDLGVFLGVKDGDTSRDQARLVGFNPSMELNCALLVDRLSGLRSEADLTLVVEPPASGPRPAFVGARYRDAAGRTWQALDMAELASNESFLRVAG